MARILVADDEQGVREFIAEALQTEGHEVAEASDGVEALAYLGREGFHLLDAPPQRLNSRDPPVPYHPKLWESHRPTFESILEVTAAFANSPITNPGGTGGVNFISDYGQGGVFTGGNLIVDSSGVLEGDYEDDEYQAHKSANFAANREGFFGYIKSLS